MKNFSNNKNLTKNEVENRDKLLDNEENMTRHNDSENLKIKSHDINNISSSNINTNNKNEKFIQSRDDNNNITEINNTMDYTTDGDDSPYVQNNTTKSLTEEIIEFNFDTIMDDFINDISKNPEQDIEISKPIIL